MTRMIINLTQHNATPEQVAEGVVDLPSELRTRLVELLTFNTLPGVAEVFQRAQDIAKLAAEWLDEQPHPEDYGRDGAALAEAMIGGAPFLMANLEAALLVYAIEPVYAFKHAGFVRMFEEQ